LSQFSHPLQTIAAFTPLYGLNQLVHAPLVGGGITWSWVPNVLVWPAIFAGGAIWRFRQDTARVWDPANHRGREPRFRRGCCGSGAW
jgi:ABC-2 type transport system permease protein